MAGWKAFNVLMPFLVFNLEGGGGDDVYEDQVDDVLYIDAFVIDV